MATFTVTSGLSTPVDVPAGFDTVDFGQLGSGIVARFALDSARVYGGSDIIARWGDDVVRVNGTAQADILVAADGETLAGRAGNDTFRDGGAAAAGSRMYGGLGNDHFTLGSIGSVARGDGGNDTFYVRSPADALVSGGEGADRVFATGGQGLDALGGAGNDSFLLKSTAHTVVFGGAGDDHVSASHGSAVRIDTGAGADRVLLNAVEGARVNTGADADSVRLLNLDNARVNTGAGDDRITMKQSDGNWIAAGEGDDRVMVGEGTLGHHLSGGAGKDVLVYWNTRPGTSDNVTLDLRDGILKADGATVARTSGFESIYTEDGDDRLVGDANANGLYGGGGEDRLFGREGDDLIYGGEGDDFIYAGNGHDVVSGGAGDDYFKAGRDGDRFIFDDLNAGETDTISIFGRLDKLDFRGAVDSLGELKIKINADDSATIKVAVDGGFHTVRIEELLDTHSLTDQLAAHVLIG
ncbi:MAG: calcium-binding protein [Geminicoccaceae bacterium]